MSADHDHGKNSSQRVLILALTVTLGYAAVEASMGWLANSLALVSDAGHMVTDAMALAVGSLAAWLSKKPATEKLSFGYQRAEVLGALFNVLFMYGIVAAIVVSSIKRLQQPEAVAFQSVMLVGGIGLLVNAFVAWLLSRGEQNLNTRGALLHVMGDLLGSVAAIAAGITIWLTGWMPIDPLLSLLICILIVISSTTLLLETVHLIMEGTPSGLKPNKIAETLKQNCPHVVDVHHIHVWSISTNKIALSAHITIPPDADGHETLVRLKTTCEACFHIHHSTFQLEIQGNPCPDS